MFSVVFQLLAQMQWASERLHRPAAEGLIRDESCLISSGVGCLRSVRFMVRCWRWRSWAVARYSQDQRFDFHPQQPPRYIAEDVALF